MPSPTSAESEFFLQRLDIHTECMYQMLHLSEAYMVCCHMLHVLVE